MTVNPTDRLRQRLASHWKTLLAVLLALVAASLLLALVSSRFREIQGWASFLGALLLAAGMLFGAWWLVKGESPPRWLWRLLIAAVALRLLAGAVWYVAAPVWGHGTQAERGGYIMADASKRDQAAWKLGSSHRHLWAAFFSFRAADQYGGLLFLSALVYRTLGGQVHQPLLVVVFTAAFSSLAVLFTWAFARRLWDAQTACLAAWILALYPEAVLLGSTQMREAFTVTLAAMAFHGLLKYRDQRTWRSLAWIFIPLLFFLPFSPPFTGLLIGMLALVALTTWGKRRSDRRRQRWFWLALAGLVVLVLLGLWLTLSQLAPEGITNPLAVLGWWARKSAELQAYASQHASGWLQHIFEITPGWAHFPILIAYGVVQPFLPAAIIVGSHAPLYPRLTLWRSVGWSAVLALLVYAPWLAARLKKDAAFARVLSLVVWAGILIAAYRGGADMWDNPRYRATFASLQIALAAWAWVQHRRLADPGLRRLLVGLGLVMLWFLPWYIRRYTALTWIVVDLFKTIGLGLASAFLFTLWDWARRPDLPRAPDPER